MQVAFFANRDIAEGKELTWDYGVEFIRSEADGEALDSRNNIEPFDSECGSHFCRAK